MLSHRNYLMVTLRLSKDKAGSQYHKILSASRRCLENFSLPFGDTGYRLVLRAEEAQLLECLTEAFMGHYTDEDMVLLSAPERDDLSEWYYSYAEESLLEELAHELISVASRIRDGSRITSRTYAESIRLLDRCEHHDATDETQAIRAFLGRIYKADIAAKRKKTARLLEQYAASIVEIEEVEL